MTYQYICPVIKNNEVWILDFDGTLYYQFPVRIIMGMWLISYYILHPFKFKELFLLLEYRKLKEKMAGVAFNDGTLFCQKRKLCSKYGIAEEVMQNIISDWMEIKPGGLIKFFQRKSLIRFVEEAQKQGTLIVIYSDNCLANKINAISFVPDCHFDSSHPLVQCFKPNVQGLNNIIKHLGKNKEDVIFIGDRHDRDGLCALGAGIQYYDVNEFIKNQEKSVG